MSWDVTGLNEKVFLLNSIEIGLFSNHFNQRVWKEEIEVFDWFRLVIQSNVLSSEPNSFSEHFYFYRF